MALNFGNIARMGLFGNRNPMKTAGTGGVKSFSGLSPNATGSPLAGGMPYSADTFGGTPASALAPPAGGAHQNAGPPPGAADYLGSLNSMFAGLGGGAHQGMRQPTPRMGQLDSSDPMNMTPRASPGNDLFAQLQAHKDDPQWLMNNLNSFSGPQRQQVMQMISAAQQGLAGKVNAGDSGAYQTALGVGPEAMMGLLSGSGKAGMANYVNNYLAQIKADEDAGYSATDANGGSIFTRPKGPSQYETYLAQFAPWLK